VTSSIAYRKSCALRVRGASLQRRSTMPMTAPSWPRERVGFDGEVTAEGIVLAPDCGVKYLARDVACGKLCAMVEGAALVRAQL
jgi:hypothetical protein